MIGGFEERRRWSSPFDGACLGTLWNLASECVRVDPGVFLTDAGQTAFTQFSQGKAYGRGATINGSILLTNRPARDTSYNKYRSTVKMAPVRLPRRSASRAHGFHDIVLRSELKECSKTHRAPIEIDRTLVQLHRVYLDLRICQRFSVRETIQETNWVVRPMATRS